MASGNCIWTFHPPDPQYDEGYWTVVDHCESGSCTASFKGVAKNKVAAAEVAHRDFIDGTSKAYEGKEDKLTPYQAWVLKASHTELKSGQTYVMPCVD